MSTQPPTPRTGIDTLPRYSVASGLSGITWRASSNESVLPPARSVIDAATEAFASAHTYPSLTGTKLVTALAEHYDLNPDGVVVGAGSIALLQYALTAYAGAGSEVVHAWRSYEAYPILVSIAGAEGVEVPLDVDAVHDVDAMLAALTPATQAVIVCNPNNPTGTLLPPEELLRLIDGVPADVLVLLDEAYWEFTDRRTDGLKLVAERPNLAVFRTFSKAYGLAAARTGFMYAQPAVAEVVRAVAPPFGLSGPSEAAGVAALAEQGHVETVVAQVAAERERLRAGLAELGCGTPSSASNFVWIPGAGEDFELAIIRRGVSVRRFAEGVRVTVGEPRVTDAILATARESFI
ncbi:aminotransferase class I/II-fold pyridoxal phosphate-dependent enzyme [Brachybacterium sp. AOP42-C2-15]|uniref:aminotransferase class I/II-fold pyridoxal phosphate-dependent enzyme n=1 Tax=Brachybacterium sp. AOP42-C2-15 TaxID=3457670 RepID=UPI003FD97D1B